MTMNVGFNPAQQNKQKVGFGTNMRFDNKKIDISFTAKKPINPSLTDPPPRRPIAEPPIIKTNEEIELEKEEKLRQFYEVKSPRQSRWKPSDGYDAAI
ncbi:MAG: hypothetical protein WCG23_08830 [bacterium]